MSIRRFRPEDQHKARALILAGLEEHFGWIDPSKNPDLDDLCVTYAAATCLVAEVDGELVGTGILVPRDALTAEIVRVSVAKSTRRQGIGRQILRELISAARRQCFQRIVLETTASWEDAVQFYLTNSFRPTHLLNGEQYFELQITADPEKSP